MPKANFRHPLNLCFPLFKSYSEFLKHCFHTWYIIPCLSSVIFSILKLLHGLIKKKLGKQKFIL